MKYQLNYSQQFPATKNQDKRLLKARKITSSLQDYYTLDQLGGMTCLDLGCSVGAISNRLAESGLKTMGVDIDYPALLEAKKGQSRAAFLNGNVENNPFGAESFDLIVCSQVYEHTPDLNKLIAEIYRLLKPKGVCFFSGPNKWALMEDHYHLPFLSWFPKNISDAYVRVMRAGDEYYEHPVSAQYLRKSMRNFSILDLTSRMIKNPGRYSMETEVGFIGAIAKWLPDFAWPLIGVIVPNFNWLLVKE